jgi:hypothetical protein
MNVVNEYTGKSSWGYVRLKLSDGRVVLKHRWVMEQHLGRPLTKDEHVHHKDKNRANNDLSNLELLTSSEHSKEHHKENPPPMVYLTCPVCGVEFERPARYIRSKNKQGQLHFLCGRTCRVAKKRC